MATFDLTTLRTITILYVEDEDIIREQSLKLYQKLFKNVFWASDGDMAYKIYSHNKNEIDVIITDINMPKISGLDLAKKVLDINKIPIIVTTAFTDTKYMLDAIDLGVKKYATKPITINSIIQDIQRIVLQYRAESNLKNLTKNLLIKSKSTSEDLNKLLYENKNLKESISLYKNLIDTYMMTLTTDKNGQILKISSKLCNLLSYETDELLNKNISLLKDINYEEKTFQKQMLEAIHKKTKIQSTHTLKSKNNKTFKFDITMNLYYGDDSLVNGYNFYLNLIVD